MATHSDRKKSIHPTEESFFVRYFIQMPESTKGLAIRRPSLDAVTARNPTSAPQANHPMIYSMRMMILRKYT
jgi:hypothetical protein